MSEFFRKFSERVSLMAGTPLAFVFALTIIAVWLVTGPIFHYSDTWQLIINTGTTIVTFLMVFVLQNTQNRESRATQIKLDELLRAIANARTSFADLEEMPDHELDRIEAEFRQLAEKASRTRQSRRSAAEKAGVGEAGGEHKGDGQAERGKGRKAPSKR